VLSAGISMNDVVRGKLKRNGDVVFRRSITYLNCYLL
jgi:hypothetical protein